MYFGYNNYTYYLDANGNRGDSIPNGPLFTTPETILRLQNQYFDFLCDMHTFPILSIVNNMVFYIFLLCTFTVIAIRDKNKLFLPVSIPLWLTIVIIIIAPCIRGHVRYAFPIIWSFPVWLYAATSSNEKGELANG